MKESHRETEVERTTQITGDKSFSLRKILGETLTQTLKKNLRERVSERALRENSERERKKE